MSTDTNEMVEDWRFGDARLSALNEWLSLTNREIGIYRDHLIYDIRDHAYECDWQRLAAKVYEDDTWHVCQFCSIGDEATSITDMLLDERYDAFVFSDKEDCEFLFRYYSRFFLVAIGIIDDLERLSNEMGFIENSKRGRKEMSTEMDIHAFVVFINTLSKHRLGQESHALHKYNHHLPKLFIDSGIQSDIPHEHVHMMTRHNPEPKAIKMPSLEWAIHCMNECYKFVDEKIRGNEDKFKAYCLRGESRPEVF